MAKAKPPFLKKLTYTQPSVVRDDYPWSIPIFRQNFEWSFTKGVTVVVGENGAGKSSLLEAIATSCGFGAQGGGRNQGHLGRNDVAPVLAAMRFSWFPRVTRGFFFRAESFFNFATYLDDLGPKALEGYGGTSLHAQSHGEAFLALFENRFGAGGIYIFDEPEAALSPSRQLAFLDIVHRLSAQENCQIIMATHSPILMSYAQAELLYIDADGSLTERSFRATPHWLIYSRFMDDPARYQPGEIEPDL